MKTLPIESVPSAPPLTPQEAFIEDIFVSFMEKYYPPREELSKDPSESYSLYLQNAMKAKEKIIAYLNIL